MDLTVGYALTLWRSDVDNPVASLTGTFVTLPDEGTLYRSDGTTPVTEASLHISPGEDTFVFRADPYTSGSPYTNYTWKMFDGSLESNVATDIINVYVTNTPPDPTGFSDTQITTLEDTSFNISLGATDQEAGAPYFDKIFFFLSKLPDHGTLEIFNRDETWSTISTVPVQLLDTLETEEKLTLRYTPDEDFNTPAWDLTPDTIKYTLRDTRGMAWLAEEQVNIFVTPTNDPPKISCTTSYAYMDSAPPKANLPGKADCHIKDDGLPDAELNVTVTSTRALNLSVADSTGVEVVTITATSFSLSGNLSAVNNALSWIIYFPFSCGLSGFPCHGSVTLVAVDSGSYGEGDGNSEPMQMTSANWLIIKQYNSEQPREPDLEHFQYNSANRFTLALNCLLSSVALMWLFN
jgi:hypothetical protein